MTDEPNIGLLERALVMKKIHINQKIKSIELDVRELVLKRGMLSLNPHAVQQARAEMQIVAAEHAGLKAAMTVTNEGLFEIYEKLPEQERSIVDSLQFTDVITG